MEHDHEVDGPSNAGNATVAKRVAPTGREIMRRLAITFSAGFLLSVNACGKGGDESQMGGMNDQAAGRNAIMADPGNPFAQTEMQMHERMMAAKGATVDETWIRKMIEHHRGAVAMSDIVIAQDPTAKVTAKAQKIRADQLNEIGELEAMLKGEDPARASATAPAARSAPAPAPVPGAAAPKVAPKPAPRTPPEEQRDTAAPKTPASKDACAPEHRALGHC